MDYYSVRGLPLSWFKSYLNSRMQSVKLKNIMSNENLITCGVPQGSILRSVLFIIFINDFPNCSNFFAFTLFADDSTLSCKIPKEQLNEFHHNINNNLTAVHDWLKCNCMLLDYEKTKCMFCLLYTSPSPRDKRQSRMPSSA